MINLPFPNKSFLHKKIIDNQKKIDFTLWDAFLTISAERVLIFYTILAENKPKLEFLINREKNNKVHSPITQQIKNYFRMRKNFHEIYCHIHIILLIINCVFEGILISKHNRYFIFNLQKSSFKRFMEIMVVNLFLIYFIKDEFYLE